MNNIEFNNENLDKIKFRSRSLFGKPETPKLVNLLIKSKLAKNEKTAGIIILIFSLFCIVAAASILTYTYKQDTRKNQIPAELLKSLPIEIQKQYENKK